MAERITRRGIVMVFSDLFDDPEEVLKGLMHLRHKRHEVVVFHVLDRAEEEFPFQESTLFRGLEQMPELLTDPRSLRDGYLEQLRLFTTELEQGCRAQNMDYVRLRTDKSLDLALSTYLARAWHGRENDVSPTRARENNRQRYLGKKLVTTSFCRALRYNVS